MSRNYLLFLEDMRQACQRIIRYRGEINKEQFLADEITYDAIIRQMMIVGEAAKQIPPAIRESYPGVDWRGMGRFCDLVVHHYFGIDNRVVWSIVADEVPNLLLALTAQDETTPESL